MDYTHDEAREKVFDAAFKAAQPPEVRAVLGMPLDQRRLDAGAALLGKGLLKRNGQPADIVEHIVGFGWRPYATMLWLASYGVTWLEPGKTAIPLPGLQLPGQPAYDPARPPAGAIMIPNPNTADIARWYPPFETPVNQPPATVLYIGQPVYEKPGHFWGIMPQSGLKSPGEEITEGGKRYRKYQVGTMFGGLYYHYWELIG